jgi:hypothetical protein
MAVNVPRQGDQQATLKIEENWSRHEYCHYDLYHTNAKADGGVKNEARSGNPDPKSGECSFRRNSGECDKEHNQYGHQDRLPMMCGVLSK